MCTVHPGDVGRAAERDWIDLLPSPSQRRSGESLRVVSMVSDAHLVHIEEDFMPIPPTEGVEQEGDDCGSPRA